MIAPMLAVKDVDASLAFYTEKLGFETVVVIEGVDGKNALAFVCMGEQAQIGFSAQRTPEPVGNGVVFMIYPPREANLDQLYCDVLRRGVTIEAPLHDDDWGDRSFSVKDPDGYWLTFTETTLEMPTDEIDEIIKKAFRRELAEPLTWELPRPH